MAEGAQILDVLREREYAEEHLPGAISLPLRQMNRASVPRLQRTIRIVTYCWDFQ